MATATTENDLFNCDMIGIHQKWLGSSTTNSHGVVAIDCATVFGCDQMVIFYYYLESAVQGRKRVRTLYQSKDPNPTQPTHGRKKKIK